MKKLITLTLALLMLCALCACGSEDEGVIDDPVINIGAQILTFRDDAGNTYTYDYLTSSTIEIVGFEGITDEPHDVVVPATYTYMDGETEIEYVVAAIGAEAFYANSSIATITLPEGLTTIDAYAFANCEAMTAITFPSTLTTVAKGAFYGCDVIAEYDFSDTALAAIGDNAFADSPALATLKLPETLKSIGASAFLNCTALTAITLPEGVTSVEAQAFYNCTAVESLTLPESLTDIGAWAFNPTARDLEDSAIIRPAGSFADEYLKTVRKPVVTTPDAAEDDTAEDATTEDATTEDATTENSATEGDEASTGPVVLPGIPLTPES